MSERTLRRCSPVLALLLGACVSPLDATAPALAHRDPPDDVVQQALETLPSGQAVRWRLAQTSEGGTIQPLRTFRTQRGFCREYAVTTHDRTGAGDVRHQVACRDPNGTWRALTDTA
jgi:surface antigen